MCRVTDTATVSRMANHDADDPRAERAELLAWICLVAVGLAGTWVAVRNGTQLGTRSAPFLGSYRFAFGFTTFLAPVVACTVLLAAHRAVFDRLGFAATCALSWLASLAWALSLALVDGAAGLTRSLQSPDNYLTDVPSVVDDPLAYLRTFTDNPAAHSTAGRGHPPGPVLLLWLLHRAGLTDQVALGVLVTALGALVVPLVLYAVRGVCGEVQARRYAPVLILAPYAVWVAVSVDVVVALLGALMVAMGVRASGRTTTGLRAGAWALGCGIALGVAALFSYAAAWLGLSVVCLYFARRRAFLNVATGLGALLPILAAQSAGFSWIDGLLMARADYAARVEPVRSAPWWVAISLVVLLLAAGPPLIRSLRRLRNTPGWPFMVGAGVAVAFSVLAGLARGGAEAAWLPFFPWLTVAAVAPSIQAGPSPRSPLMLVTVGALTAVVVEAVLATPW
jgi:methylthioxylose transferase